MSKEGSLNISRIRGVVFDLDGTLVDSQLDFEAIRAELGFPPGQPILEHVATLTDTVDIENAHQVIWKHELAGSKAARWMPGAEQLLQQLLIQDVPLAILTRNMRVATQLTIESLGIPIELVLTREDCKPKPDPEGLFYIARQWQMACENILYIGDYIFDIEAANRANMVSCFYCDAQNRGNPRSKLFAEQADWVIEHFDELTEAFSQGRLNA